MRARRPLPRGLVVRGVVVRGVIVRGVIVLGLALSACEVPHTFAPRADALENQPPTDLEITKVSPTGEVVLGNRVTLAASARDADGDALGFSWSQVGGSAVFDAAGFDASTFAFTLPVAAAGSAPLDRNFVFLVRVSDGFDEDFANYRLEVSSRQVPVADAGDDQQVAFGATVQLDGTQTRDADGDTFSLGWTQLAGHSVDLSSDTIADPVFVAPSEAELLAPEDGTLVFELTATDPSGSHTDQVVVTVADLPLAQIPLGDQVVAPSTLVLLEGQGTLPQGGSPLYAWQQLAGPAVTLASPDASTASFTAPPQAAVLRFSLRVGDGVLWSSPASTTVVVNPQPTAHAPDYLEVENGGELTLIGSGTDPGGEAIQDYLWAIESTPVGSACAPLGGDPLLCLFSPGAPVTSFQVDRKGTWLLSLVVTDVSGAASPKAFTLVESQNRAPQVAITVTAGTNPPHTDEAVQLAAQWSDDDGDLPLSYRWSVVGDTGFQYAFEDPVGAAPDPTVLPEVVFRPRERRRFIVGLLGNDGESDSPAALFAIDVLNTLPVAVIAEPLSVVNGSPLELDGTGSFDADLEPLTYRWTYLGLAGEVDAAQLSGSSSATATLVPLQRTPIADPALCAATPQDCHAVRLVVSDGEGDSAPTLAYIVALNRAPLADAGADRADLAAGAPVILDASDSSDPDSDALRRFAWSCQLAPGNACATVLTSIPVAPGDPAGMVRAALATFVPPTTGTYIFGLTVSDGDDDGSGLWSTNPTSVTLTVDNSAPVAHLRVCDRDLDGDGTPCEPVDDLCAQGRSTVSLGSEVCLMAGTSFDPEGDAMTFTFDIVSGDGTPLLSDSSAVPALLFTFPEIEAPRPRSPTRWSR